MDFRPSKIRKKEGSASMHDSCNDDPHPQDVHEPQPLALPSAESYPEADTLQGTHVGYVHSFLHSMNLAELTPTPV